VLRLIDVGPPPVIAPAPGISTGRLDATLQVRNLAVPGARVQDVLTTRPDPRDGINTLTDIVLGLPAFVPNVGDGVARSQIEFAEELKPSVVLLWIGNNDALGAALAADPAGLTPQADFERAYAEVARRVRATGARVVVANIPDVTVVPYLTSAAEVALLLNLPAAFVNARLGIADGDYVTPAAFPLIAAILSGASTAPLPANTVLTRAEAGTIRERVAGFNRFIARQAQRNNFALADINSLLNRIDRFGYPVLLSDPFEIRLLTTTFLGGLFSLDGVHPTNTGYAIIANEFIRELDSRFGAQLLPVNVWRIAGNDPLVLRGAANERVPRAPVAASAAVTGDVLGAVR
jgi:lysophospholipase L1-like esterase